MVLDISCCVVCRGLFFLFFTSVLLISSSVSTFTFRSRYVSCYFLMMKQFLNYFLKMSHCYQSLVSTSSPDGLHSWLEALLLLTSLALPLG
uniref:Uncharacterized protein n=1 Tax=Anguilla anguilla TaxID=7936 RepID=A0A0E9PWK2_ANGAN